MEALGKTAAKNPDDVTKVFWSGGKKAEDAASKANLCFMEKLLAACAGNKTFELSGAEGVEAAFRKSEDGRKIYIYLLNHSEKTAENVTLKFSDPAILKAIVFEQESCSATEIKADKSMFRIPRSNTG